MCVLLTAFHHHSRFDLVVAANRDEFYARPANVAAYWDDYPGIFAGRDLEAMGTWLGVNTGGRFAAVTNLRGGADPHARKSRGHLVRDFLSEAASSAQYTDNLLTQAHDYAGCNLFVADNESLVWWSGHQRQTLGPGVYGISNSSFHDEWPKVGRLKTQYQTLADLSDDELTGALFAMLRASDERLRTARVGPLEDTIFVQSANYGTRCSTVVLRDTSRGILYFAERSFDPAGRITGEVSEAILLVGSGHEGEARTNPTN